MHIKSKINKNVYFLILNSPGAKLNSLSDDVITEFKYHIQQVEANPTVVAAVIMSAKSGCFIAGADIKFLEAAKSAKTMEKSSQERQQLRHLIENSTKPYIALIKGICFGGGLEIALACHYRIAVCDQYTKLGFPEVTMGLLPGAGGTQRLPRLVGLQNALNLILSGKRINSEEAQRIGLVDQTLNLQEILLRDGNAWGLMEETAVNAAMQIANDSWSRNVKRPRGFYGRIKKYVANTSYFRNKVFEKATEEVLQKTGGFYPAPLKILKVIHVGLEKGETAGYAAEAKAFGELSVNGVSKALMSLMRAQANCRRNKFGSPNQRIDKIGILGAGLMGSGIARVSVDKDYEVVLKDTDEQALNRARERIEKGLDDARRKGTFARHERDRFLNNLNRTLKYEDLEDVDMVIEAVFEDVDVKHRVIKEVEAVVSENCIIASNTSAISIAEIARGSSRPDKVIGMHYFSPVDRMQLLEVIATRDTSKETIAATVAVGLKQGKTVITVGDGPGFYTTRVLAAMTSEAVRLLQEGVHPRKLDLLCKKFGFPIGVMSLMDALGLDVGSNIAAYLTKALGPRFSGGDLRIMQDVIASGCLGKKTGKGIYVYEAENKNRNREVNPVAAEILKRYALKAPVRALEGRRKFNEEDWQLRMVARFVNEAVVCLEEKILTNPQEGDVGAVFGLGFPPFTGGPFKWVDAYGAQRLVSRMQEYETCYGECFKPARTLIQMANDPSMKFYPQAISMSVPSKL